MRLKLDPSQVIRYPHALTLGALPEEDAHELVYRLGKEIGNQCHALGVQMNFAPVADVNNNPENPIIHDRSFGDNPKRVGLLSSAYMHGLQDAGVLACAKHFPGHGDTALDSHHALPVLLHDAQRLADIELVPFKALIENGVSMVMNGHLLVPTLDTENPSSLSAKTIKTVLKEDLNFQGLIITDALDMKAVSESYVPGQLELQALLAGNDLLLCPLDIPAATDAIRSAITDNRMRENDLDQRLLKILLAKKWTLSHPKNSASPLDYIIRPDARALQRELYQKAITLVKKATEADFCEKSVTESYYVQAGELPDQILPTLLPAQKDHAASNITKANVILALAGMHKRATERYGITDQMLALLKQLKNNDNTVTTIVFGTPYSVPHLQESDTLIVAYEDCAAAQEAVANILLGKQKAVWQLPITL